MQIIVAADKHWAIGKDGDLLWHLPEDMKFLREKTTGNVVVMGRKTLESCPGGQPLKNRTNIVLSTNPDYQVKGAIVVHSKEELLKELEKYDSDSIYVIGGATIYKMMLPYCDTIHVTKIDHAYEADTFFVNLDEMPEWKITADSDEQTYFDLEYVFLKYERVKNA